MTKQQQDAVMASWISARHERARQNALLVDPSSALDEAVRAGNVGDIEFLVQHGVSIADALRLAAAHGQLSVVDALIRVGADVNAEDGDSDTALHRAAKEGHLDVVTALLRAGANVNARNKHGITVLYCAAWSGHGDVATALVQHGAEVNARSKVGKTALYFAAESGFVDVVTELIRLGADLHIKDHNGFSMFTMAASFGRLGVVTELIRHGASDREEERKSALLTAAGSGHVDVVNELIRHGADVNASDANGYTALSQAAKRGRITVVTELIRHGANVNIRDKLGETALYHTAALGRAEIAAELIRHGADVSIKDEYGRTAFDLPIERKHTATVAVLLRRSVFDEASSPTDDEVLLFAAAVVGRLNRVEELVAKDVNIEAETKDGRTVLLFAAEYGRLNVVAYLIECGANVAAKARADPKRPRESETPLTLAGRAWHMEVWQALVQAGAPVNVRSNVDGETPLISVARADYFPAVQQLIARGGKSVLCVEDAQDDECPLLPGSLATMTAMCATVTFEFEGVCSRMLQRLQDVCAQLQQRQRDASKAETPPPTAATNDVFVTFASILFRACRLLFDIEKKATVFVRFVASRAILQRIHTIYDELNHFGVLHQLLQAEAFVSAEQQSRDDEEDVQQRFERALNTDDALMDGFEVYDNTDVKHFYVRYPDDDFVDKQDTRYDMAVLLQHELAIRRHEQNARAQAIVSSVLQRFVRACKMKSVPQVPAWFISPDDLEFHDWNLVTEMENKRKPRRTKCYAGKWRGTRVRIKTSIMNLDKFTKAAATWHSLSHPNVLKLFGACHIGSDKLFINETVPDATTLHAFLRDASNRMHTWRCLYQAALGLQYLHDREVAHGYLCNKAIVVGSDGAVKLDKVGGARRKSSYIAWKWRAPGYDRSSFLRFAQADVYMFGLCIWVAVVGELSNDVGRHFRTGGCPARPPNMTEGAYDLIKSMCAHEPSDRLDTASVVRRLKQFANEAEQTSVYRGDDNASGTSCVYAKIQSQRLDEYAFPDIGCHSIPNALAHIQSRCEDLPDTQWMLESVLPALAFVFRLLQERRKTPLATEVTAFCAAVARLQRFVRTAVSNKSVYQQMRSRKVAESHHLVYTQLDQLLDMLDVPVSDSIRRWRHEAAPSILNPVDLSDARVPVIDFLTSTTTTDTKKPSNSPSDAITLNHHDTPPAMYEQWTRDGLFKAASTAQKTSESASMSQLSSLVDGSTPPKRPSWYLSLKQLTFSESDQIGQGAFGAVLRGSWRGTPVVIKFMGYEEDIETISTDLLLHEVRVWHRLNHPHVLKLFGASHVDKRYFVCEFAGNGELRAYLKQSGNSHLTWQKLHEAALGLQYLHSMNVAHNDLKCDNIMVGLDHKAKLIDFGLSCLLGEAEVQIDVKKIGAVNWRSPEYLAGGRPSCASDVYSFAMCIIEAVSGEPPWGPNPVQAGQVRFWLRRGMSPPLPASMTSKQRNLIELMTKTEPSERVNMAFVVNKLEEIVQDASASVAP